MITVNLIIELKCDECGKTDRTKYIDADSPQLVLDGRLERLKTEGWDFDIDFDKELLCAECFAKDPIAHIHFDELTKAQKQTVREQQKSVEAVAKA